MTDGRGWRAPTVRLWTASLCGSLLLLLLFVVVERVEIAAGLRNSQRLVRAADEFPTRVVGISHHLVAAFFLLTSARVRTPAGWGSIGLLVLGGAGLSLAFQSFGGARNPVCLGVFYVAFIAHVFRDEIFFYGHYARQAGRDVAADARQLRWVQVAALGLLGAILVPGLSAFAPLGGAPWLPRPLPVWLSFLEPIRAQRGSPVPSAFPAGWTWLGAGLVLTAPFLVVLAVAGGRMAGEWSRLLRVHAPVVIVLGGSVALTAGSLLLGGWMLKLVILMHFVSWFLFTTARLRSAPSPVEPRARRRPTAWLRSTLPGFWTLHGGLALAVLGLIVLDHVVLGHRPIAWGGQSFANPLALLLSRDAFYAWTILHVTLSWTPRG